MLVQNWRAVLKHAWSIKLITVAGLLSGAEVLVPLLQEQVPRGIFAALAAATAAGAFIARIMAQASLREDGHGQ